MRPRKKGMEGHFKIKTSRFSRGQIRKPGMGLLRKNASIQNRSGKSPKGKNSKRRSTESRPTPCRENSQRSGIKKFSIKRSAGKDDSFLSQFLLSHRQRRSGNRKNNGRRIFIRNFESTGTTSFSRRNRARGAYGKSCTKINGINSGKPKKNTPK